MMKQTTLNHVIDKYDIFLLDQWGVIHDGVKLYPGVLDALKHIKNSNKKIFIISNTTRIKKDAEVLLNKLGLKGLYDGVMTSGEQIMLCLKNNFPEFFHNVTRDTKFYVYNWYFSQKTAIDYLGYEKVDNIEDSDFVFASGIADQSLETYKRELPIAAKLNIPLIIANPDIVAIQGNAMHHCPGILIKLYEQLGGKIFVSGKPNSGMYELLLKDINYEKKKVIGVGDSLIHDIKGANDYGVDSLLIVNTGILSTEVVHQGKIDQQKLKKICTKEGIEPTLFYSQFSLCKN